MQSSLSRPRSRREASGRRGRTLPESYGNFVVRGVERPALVAWLAAKTAPAWIGPVAAGWIGVAEESADAFDLARTCELTLALTADLGGAAIAAAVHNADVLGILAIDAGRHVASYVSYPGIFEEGIPREELKPEITGAEGMLAALGVDSDTEELARVLAVGTPEQFVYPTALHAAFVRAFDLPRYTLSFGFRIAETGMLPAARSDFVRV